MKQIYLFFLIIFVHVAFLLYALSGLSISYYEADILFNQNTPLHYLVDITCKIFGYNDFGLRVPFLFIHVINICLIYLISKNILKKPQDCILSVIVYVMLPGVNASALIVNEASTAILFTLLFVWCWQSGYLMYAYLVLILSLGIDNSFVILYLSLFFYGIIKKRQELFVLSLVLFSLSMYIYGFDSGGKPSGHFLDTMGVYAAALSPLLFLYYIYTLYRITIKEEKHILWYISFGAFIFTLLFSLRQRLMLEDFLPFAIICIPLMVRVFFNSYRVRLPRYRKLHKVAFYAALLTLSVSFFLVIENRVLYLFLQKPKQHFAYKNNVAKELSQWLLKKNIKEVSTTNKRLALRLKFYGIMHGDKYKLKKVLTDNVNSDIFTLKFRNSIIVQFALLKNEKKEMNL